MGKLLSLLVLFLLSSCQTESQKKLRKVDLLTPTGEVIHVRLAITLVEQEQGLSGVKPGEFEENEGMLFIYPEDGEKYFWMPDTYFDLDLFYLDKNLKILDIIRKLPHYVGRANPDLIPKARGVWSRHVLEMKATSEIAKELKAGDVLKWKGEVSLEELDQAIKSNSIQ